jgi:shikimate dehydrogenase
MTMIDGSTKLIAHLGFPTESFKAPMIYNPYFRKHGINAVVVPMGCKPQDYAGFLRLLFRLSNIHGALVTMPHKVATVALLDEASVSVKVAGACNAIRIDPDGRLVGDMFDGEGFVRGVQRKGRTVTGARVLVVGCGGVGSAIAAALAKAGAAQLALFDTLRLTMDSLAQRLQTHYPKLKVDVGSADPAGFDIVVNASPLGMKVDDPLPMNVDRIAPSTFVGEVVMKQEITPLLAAVRARGCEFQIGTDMLFEQIPAYLEFFGFGLTTAEELRGLTEIND